MKLVRFLQKLSHESVTIELNPRERRLYDRLRGQVVRCEPGASSGWRDVLLLLPDLTVLLARLLRDARVPRGDKLVALLGVGYALSPIDHFFLKTWNVWFAFQLTGASTRATRSNASASAPLASRSP